MGLKAYRPTSPGRRGMTAVTGEDLAKKRPEKSLTESRRSSGGRNNDGRMTVRARGSGHKRLYRLVDFKRDKVGVPARVVAIEYDPNRSARLALLHYVDGEKRYILAPQGLAVKDTVQSGPSAEVKPGNALPLAQMPLGTTIHNLELKPGKGGQPQVRGAAMNPVDHPRGGGEGKSGQGNPHPVSPWGLPTKGYKTRQNKATDKFIIARRKKGIR